MVPFGDWTAVGSEEIHEANSRKLRDELQEIVSKDFGIVGILIFCKHYPNVLDRARRIGLQDLNINSIIPNCRRLNCKLDPSCRNLSGSCIKAKSYDSISIVKKDVLVGLLDVGIVALDITQ